MTPLETLALCGTATGAGVVNTLAGGGSLLTVPLLVLLGLPGGVANGTNRVGILLQSGVAAWRFRALGVGGLREAAARAAAGRRRLPARRLGDRRRSRTRCSSAPSAS